MSDVNRGNVAMLFGDGSKIDTWTRFQLHDSFTDPLGSLTFETAPPAHLYLEYRNRLAKGEPVTVLINGVSQGRFLIQTVDREVSRSGGRALKVTCHTPLVTPYQAHVDPDFTLSHRTDVSVSEALLEIFRPFGFDAVATDTRAHASAISGRPIGGGSVPITVAELKHSDAKAHENETAYAFATRIVTQLGVVVRVNFAGTIMVSAPNYDQAASYTVVQSSTSIPGDYFIDKVHIHDSNDDQFSECTIRGQRPDQVGQSSTQRPVATVLDSVLHQDRPSYTSFAAPFKPKILKNKNARDPQRAKSMAEFELGFPAKDAFWIEGEVHGMVARTGAIWTVDTIARVVVEAERFDEEMFLLDRTFTMDASGGQKTKLKFIPKGSLVLGSLPS